MTQKKHRLFTNEQKAVVPDHHSEQLAELKPTLLGL